MKNVTYDEYDGSDEDSHDAYLERMKEEGKIREEHANDSSEDSGEETGEISFIGWPDFSKLLSLAVGIFLSLLLHRGKRLAFPVNLFGLEIRVFFSFLFFPDESFNPVEEEEDVAEE